MLIIPAIDLLDGNVVRLLKGDMENNVTVYSSDPVTQAELFAEMGVKRLHIVDLNGARDGSEINIPIIQKIAAIPGLEVEVGGGIRDVERLRIYFDAGVKYAILGTSIVKTPEFAKQALMLYPRKIIFGIDARAGIVATHGWYETSGIDAKTLVGIYSDFKAACVIYTDIERDGTLQGVNIDELVDMANSSPFPIIASGGVSCGADIDKIRQLNHPNIVGCIIGKAYYENKIDLREELSK